MTMFINESLVEEAAIAWFQSEGYDYNFGPTIAPGEPGAERDSFETVILEARLQSALAQ